MSVLLFGIVNITEDSFSDGGKFLAPEKAIAQAQKLLEDGADVIELSGASSNPNARPVVAQEQIARMEPVLESLIPILRKNSKYRDGPGLPISIDASDIHVQRWALEKNVGYLNDVTGFPDASHYPILARSSAKLILMHSTSRGKKARQEAYTTADAFDSLYSFFTTRVGALERAGIPRERLIADPGMGFFLSSDPSVSWEVLETLPEIRERVGLPMMISVSRKSFLRGDLPPDSPEVQRKTLEAEVGAARRGVECIRTHEVRKLKNALQNMHLQ